MATGRVQQCSKSSAGRRIARGATGVALTALALTGCGSLPGGTKNTLTGALAHVNVEGGAAGQPTVTIATTPLQVTGVEKRVVTRGSGPALGKSDLAAVHLQVLDGTDGRVAMSTWAAQAPGRVDLSSPRTLPILLDQLEGAREGERVVVAARSSQAFGSEGNAPLGLEPADPAVLVIDVVGISKPLTAAAGFAVAPKAGLPKVVMDGTNPARITMPMTPAPSATVAQPLVRGRGQEVTAGQLVRVAYTGVLWESGKQFGADASLTTPIGTSQSLPGWDHALVGQRVGSRILLVVPPADGYGPEGRDKVAVTDTMVFVIDILAAI